MAAIIGIDLGTTYSAVATIDETGRPVIVHNSDGQNITPSCVTEHDGVIEIGEYARRAWGASEEQAAARFKRDMGTETIYSINGREFTPTELSVFVLKKLLKDTKSALGSIGSAVVTIPANFSNEAREATLAAAKVAGLNIKYIINEPTAAALYYAFRNKESFNGIYAVYDLGGGTFDISLIKVSDQDVEVLATNGVSKLGGSDFDNALVELVADKYKSATNEAMHSSDYSTNDAEEDKKSLSKRDRVMVKVGRELIEVTKSEFEERISKYIAQTEMLCESTLEEAGLELADINSVLLAGGSTRIPAIRESIVRVFKREPEASVNVDEVVALGAALYAAYKSDKSELTTVQRNSLEKIKVTESTSKCFGTISIGSTTNGGPDGLVNNILISKGEKIPCSVTRSFYTTQHNQTQVRCRLTESTAAESDPRFVKIIWEGFLDLPPNRPAEQEIKVTYSYDENQTMRCTFVDVNSGRKTEVDLSMANAAQIDSEEIDKFLVE